MVEYTRPPSHSHSAPLAQQNPESVIYRLDPAREAGRLVFQLGTSDAARAVAAARLVAPDVAGIDVNAGCPKPFSVTGGMGAALLRTPEKLAGILEALVREITPQYQVGISVKIRLLETAAETEALVRRLVATGITGLTVHCRTTPMRPRERAIRGQLRMIAGVCREAGVACLMNGDVADRDQAEALVREYGVDGAMIATAAEKNPSCFRSAADGGLASWQEAVERYLRYAMEVENKLHNSKFLLTQMIPGKAGVYKEICACRSYSDFVKVLRYAELEEMARETDRLLGLGEFEVKVEKKKGKQKNSGGQQAQPKKRKREGSEEAKQDAAKRVAEMPDPAPVAAAAASVAV
jgi:tRNA-dihydrouridine synthase 2